MLTLHQAAAEMIRSQALVKATVGFDGHEPMRLTREQVADMLQAKHGWVWLDDDGWEHNPNPQHPQKRGEADYGSRFRPATADDAQSPEYLRVPEVHMTFGATPQ
jgi:hypothetical protein